MTAGKRGGGEAGKEHPERTAGPSPAQEFEFTVLSSQTERLDRFLADQLGISRTQAARLVADKLVAVDGKPARSSRLLARGERVAVQFPTEQPPRTLQPAAIPLTL